MNSIEERTAAREAEVAAKIAETRRLARPEDYVWDKAQEAFWDLRDGTLNGEKAVDGSIPMEFWRVVVEGDEPRATGPGRPRQRRERVIPPSKDIMRIETDQTVEGSTWWPGQEQIIRDVFIDRDGFYPSKGRRIYNQYKEPPKMGGDAGMAGPWIKHVRELWPEDSEYFFDYCAHMVQHPEVKCNAAIVMSGSQGIGKDAALNPVKAAVGSWNTKNVDPDELFSPYKPWLQTLMLVVDEVRPTKDDFHASSMYNILKPLIVTPPDTLPLNDKYAKLRHVINVMRVFITTNDWMAMYIPEEDRRMYIMHSTKPPRWASEKYFIDLFEWYAAGGNHHVAAWLRSRDLSHFNPKGLIQKTAGWDAVANTWSEPDDAIGQALDLLDRPDVVFASELTRVAFDGREDIVAALKSPRKIGHRMHRAGYLVVYRPDKKRWEFGAQKEVQCKAAFVKMALAGNKEEAIRLVEEKGKTAF